MAIQYTTGEQVRQAVEEICGKLEAKGGLQNVFCVACGGSLSNLYPLYYLLRSESKKLWAQEINANEFVHAAPAGADERALVVCMSMTGTTPETVAAAKKAKELGATVITIAGTEDSPMSAYGDYRWIFSNETAGTQVDYAACNMALALRLGFELLRVYEGYAHYDKAMAGFSVLDRSVHHARAMVQKRAVRFGEEHKDDPVIYTVGSGPSYNTAYAFSICILLEMEWINSSCIHAGEMFHGPFEIADFNTPFVIFMSEGKNRYLDERALRFLQRYAGRVSIIDAKELGVSIIAPEVEEYFSAIYNWVVAYEYAKELAIAKR
ncbi:MAG TPA: SIS domain-containing protein, partial [Candidatus Pygmaiobacter gallistercoris]|nr:SIS domain-containing protein [Candidatus Pygmaiobacter gallistercoris]